MELTDKKWKHYKLKDLFVKRTMKGYPKDDEDLTECVDGYHVFGQNIRYQYPIKVKMDKKYLHIVDPDYPILAYTSSVGEIGIIAESFYRSGDNGAFQGLFPKDHKFNKTELLFILSVLNMNFQHFDYTTSMANMMDIEFPLPIDTNGNPDWEWIDQYMKSLEADLDIQVEDIMEVADGDKDIIKTFSDKVEIKDFKAWLNDNANMDNDNQMSLDERKWTHFRLRDLFTKKTMKGYPKDDEDLIENKNGYHIFGQNIKYQYPQKVLLNEKYLHKIDPEYPILAYTSSVGEIGIIEESFYRSGDNGAFQGLFPKEHKFNKTELLFILSVLNLSFQRYNYTTSMANMMDMQFPLPVDENGNPDWEWIEQYMKSLPYSDKEHIGA